MERMKETSRRATCLLAASALAMTTQAHAERSTSVVNASGTGGAPVASRLRRILDSQDRLAPQPDLVEAALGGVPIGRPSFDDVRKAFSDFRYQDAERLLEDLSDRLLASGSVDAIKPLAEVLWWRGLMAAVDDREKPTEQRRKSKLYFTAAFALDSELTTDAAVTPPRVRLLMDEARRGRAEEGLLQLEADAEDAELSIDGGSSTELLADQEIPTGLHLLQISAPERGSVLRLVEVNKGSTVRLSVELPPEAKPDTVRRLISEASSVPEGKPRLPVLTRLSRLVETPQLLLVEGVDDERAKIRLYDLPGKRMSQQFSFAPSDSSTAVAALVDRAYRFDGGPEPERRWFQRWQVWAGVGVVAVSVIAVAVAVNASEEPRIRGL
jgi:hypothetical protein